MGELTPSEPALPSANQEAKNGTPVSAEPPIAVIDDDQSLRTALGRLVRSLGYGVRGFASADDLLESGALGDFACIITDIQMPGMSGIELKQHLNTIQCTVPVIMITARTDGGLEEAALASGAVCFLRKPFAASALSDCIARALAGGRGVAERS
jgi:FixJ family two-component response regulator